MSSEQITVERNDAAGRYEVLVDDVVAGFTEFSDDTQLNIRTFPHTEISSEHGGRGLAGTLVGQALAETKEQGLLVRAVCPFVAGYIEKNPDAAHLA